MGKKGKKAVCIFGADFMLDQVKSLQDNVPGALVGKDIEQIHRMRVASRRLRSAFSHFEACIPRKKMPLWVKEIKRITRSLGRARDLDIKIELINQLYEESLDAKYKPGYNRLLLRLKQNRTKAQKKVEKTIHRLQEDKVLKKMGAYFKDLSEDSEGIYLYTPSLYQRSFNAINDTLTDFLSYKEFVHSPENSEKLHAMRIAGKHLRYSIELFAPVYRNALLPYIQVMKNIQDHLGALHDCDVWIAWLPKFIEKEQARVEAYFGNTGPLKRLLPGINHLIEDRKKARSQAYQSFITTWENLEDENAWEVLKELIKAPIHIEEAVEHLTVEPVIGEKTIEKPDEENTEFEVEVPPEEITELEVEVPPEENTEFEVEVPPNVLDQTPEEQAHEKPTDQPNNEW